MIGLPPELTKHLAERDLDELSDLSDIFELVSIKYRNDVILVALVEVLARHFALSPMSIDRIAEITQPFAAIILDRVGSIREQLGEDAEDEAKQTLGGMQ